MGFCAAIPYSTATMCSCTLRLPLPSLPVERTDLASRSGYLGRLFTPKGRTSLQHDLGDHAVYKAMGRRRSYLYIPGARRQPEPTRSHAEMSPVPCFATTARCFTVVARIRPVMRFVPCLHALCPELVAPRRESIPFLSTVSRSKLSPELRALIGYSKGGMYRVLLRP